uniref:Uncharacterized protein n=1 Tax=Arcella intermedia TaxID=1963864 RepID=A0A6B2LLS6_9EUKA
MEEGNDVNLQNEFGDTALHIQAKNKNRQACINLLKDSKANPNIQNKEGKTPLHIACELANVGIVSNLLRYKADCDITDHLGNTPLLTLVVSGNTKSSATIAGTIVNRGASPHVVNKEGRSLLHYAAIKGDSELIRMLLSLGLDPLRKDNNGQTPLDLALNEAIQQLLSPKT